MPKTKNPLAEKVKQRLDEHEAAQAHAKEFKNDKQPQSDLDLWELAWSRQIEVFDGWLKPAVRAGADYQAEQYEVEEGVELRSMPSRSLIVLPKRIDIAPVAGLSEDGQRMGRIESLTGKYTLFWQPGDGSWSVGKLVEVVIKTDLAKIDEERRKKLKLPPPIKGRRKATIRKHSVWELKTQPLTRERFEEVVEELL